MITKRNKGWRNVLMLCAAALVAVLVSSCRAPASDAGRYQWMIMPHDEYRREELYVIDTATGEVAKLDNGSKWIPADVGTSMLPDWNDIRKQREEINTRAKLERKQQEEARVKREALVKSYSQMPLEKQVAWAKAISIHKFIGKKNDPLPLDKKNDFLPPGLIRPAPVMTHVETLKTGHGSLEKSRWPYKATDDNLVVWFLGMAEGSPLPLEFGLSRTPMEKEHIYSAPATIIDDVKAEIKRQEEKKKETHAENH